MSMVQWIMAQEQVQHRMEGSPQENECQANMYHCSQCILCLYCATHFQMVQYHCVYVVCSVCNM